MTKNKFSHNSLETNTAPSMAKKLANKFGANTASLMAEKFKTVPPLLDLSRVAPSRIEQFKTVPPLLDLSRVAPSRIEQFKTVPPLLDLSRVAPSRIEQFKAASSPLKELVESAKANNSPFIER